MLEALWSTIRDKHGVAAVGSPLNDAQDDDISEPALECVLPPTATLEPVAGFTCFIAYCNATGEISQRRVTCIRLEEAGRILYLRAFCHMRGLIRLFRLDRVEAVADILTGELIAEDAVEYFRNFSIDHRQPSEIGWGLSVPRRSDVLAGMNALVFMARCDKEYPFIP